MKRIQRAASVPGQPKASDLWRTPPALYAALDAEFGFGVDLAASADNRLHSRFLGPGSVIGEDALSVGWASRQEQAYRDRAEEEPTSLVGPGFCNPPYSAALIKRFARKVAEEAAAGFTTVMLVKLDPSTQWWAWMRFAVEIREIDHRVPFLAADGVTKAAGAMFPSAVVVFRPQPGILRAQPRRVVWSYRPAKPAVK